jgi:hypothetical protein
MQTASFGSPFVFQDGGAALDWPAGNVSANGNGAVAFIADLVVAVPAASFELPSPCGREALQALARIRNLGRRVNKNKNDDPACVG